MKEAACASSTAPAAVSSTKAPEEGAETGQVAGAALDVFEEEPAKRILLFGMENVICTPHLGASTTEAQENVALQIAEQISDYLLRGAVTNALNMASVSAEDAPRLRPISSSPSSSGSLRGSSWRRASRGCVSSTPAR